MKKIIFIDVDGTLCDNYGDIPTNTKKAIKLAQQNGHLLYTCTGRSKGEITEEIEALNFDGMIGAGGGYIESHGKIIKHEVIDPNDVVRIMNYFDQHDIGYYLETNDGIYASKNCAMKIKEVTSTYFKQRDAKEFDWFIDLLLPIDENTIQKTKINKISFINTKLNFKYIKKEFGDRFDLLQSTVISFGKHSGEIALKGIDKKSGIEELIDYLGINKKDVIAIGDGNNDIPMFEASYYNIAMGNATDNLKSIAHEVTKNVDEDGLYLSFKNNGLI